MISEDLKNRIIKDNPLHMKCEACGHEEDIYGATVRRAEPDEGPHEYFVIFGSDADFCTRCGETWGK